MATDWGAPWVKAIEEQLSRGVPFTDEQRQVMGDPGLRVRYTGGEDLAYNPRFPHAGKRAEYYRLADADLWSGFVARTQAAESGPSWEDYLKSQWTPVLVTLGVAFGPAIAGAAGGGYTGAAAAGASLGAVGGVAHGADTAGEVLKSAAYGAASGAATYGAIQAYDWATAPAASVPAPAITEPVTFTAPAVTEPVEQITITATRDAMGTPAIWAPPAEGVARIEIVAPREEPVPLPLPAPGGDVARIEVSAPREEPAVTAAIPRIEVRASRIADEELQRREPEGGEPNLFNVTLAEPGAVELGLPQVTIAESGGVLSGAGAAGVGALATDVLRRLIDNATRQRVQQNEPVRVPLADPLSLRNSLFWLALAALAAAALLAASKKKRAAAKPGAPRLHGVPAK